MKLSEYIAENKEEILRRVETSTRPLLPQEEATPEFRSLRKPFDAQARVIEASRRALERQKACFVIGEMGTGKTLIGSLVSEDGSKIIVLCPSHLTEKWVREIHETRPHATAVIIRSLADCDRLISEVPTGKQTLWYVLSKETAKLSYLWKSACRIKTEKRWIYDRQKQEQILSEIQTCLCPDCNSYITRTDSRGNEFFISPDTLERSRMFCPRCKAALWSADNKRNRKYALSEYLKKRHAKLDYLIIDEAHEYKAQDSAQGNSLGALASISDRKIMLTGTLIGGYATHLYYLMWRVLPSQMKARGYSYSNARSFIAQYGVREQILREYEGDASSNKRSKGLSNRGSWQERPGISPELFTDFLLGNALYLQLEDLAADLPPLEEEPISVEMSPDQELAYRHLEGELKRSIAQDLARGNKRLLSKLLINLLAFPDKPFDNAAIEIEKELYVEVPNLDSRQSFPKEEKLVELALEAKERGSKTLVYCQFTSSRDVQPRLQEKLQEAGLKAAILRSNVKPEHRERWIRDNAPDTDCLICNPEIVKTGLDLYDFTTIVFYQTGYNIFTLRQASRRSWRLGQKQACKVFYLYYQETMQNRAIDLIANKINSATALDGRLSSEGLNQLADEDDTFILAKALVEGLKAGKPSSFAGPSKPIQTENVEIGEIKETKEHPQEITCQDQDTAPGIGDILVLLLDAALAADCIAQNLNIDLEAVYGLLMEAQKKDQIFLIRTPGAIYWCSRRNLLQVEYAQTRVVQYLRENGHSSYFDIKDAITSPSLREHTLQQALINLKASRQIVSDRDETDNAGNGLIRSIYWVTDMEDEHIEFKIETQAKEETEKESPDVRAMRQKIETTKYNITLMLADAAVTLDMIEARYSQSYRIEGIHNMLADLERDGKIMRHRGFILLPENYTEEPLIEDSKPAESHTPIKPEVVKDFEYYRKLRDSRIASRKTRRTSRKADTPQLTLFG